MKSFEIPQQYRSQIISQIKSARKSEDPRKQDFTPTELDFGPIRFLIARHFGFCYGVENAIEIAHETIDENPGKRIFLLSEMIHNPPSVIVRNFEEAQFLCEVILGVRDKKEFYSFFEGKYSPAFDVDKDLVKIGVVNQTTMLAGETQAIANMLRETLIKKYGENNLSQHYADTRDTLCYATNDNQSATMALTQEKADLAIVIGGYNSSNTSHLVELLEDKFPTYFVSGADKIISKEELTHFDIHTRKEIYKKKFLPENEQVTIAITSGASCPDSIVDAVLNKLLSFYDEKINLAEALSRK